MQYGSHGRRLCRRREPRGAWCVVHARLYHTLCVEGVVCVCVWVWVWVWVWVCALGCGIWRHPRVPMHAPRRRPDEQVCARARVRPRSQRSRRQRGGCMVCTRMWLSSGGASLRVRQRHPVCSRVLVSMLGRGLLAAACPSGGNKCRSSRGNQGRAMHAWRRFGICALCVGCGRVAPWARWCVCHGPGLPGQARRFCVAAAAAVVQHAHPAAGSVVCCGRRQGAGFGGKRGGGRRHDGQC
jgi:hypothetical protein